MATFLICYSDVYQARDRHWPLQGSTVKIDTLEDIDTFINILGGSKVIIKHMSDYSVPWWAKYHDGCNYEENSDNYIVDVLPDNYIVDVLPDGWETMRSWRDLLFEHYGKL